jgi:hypothetical protein
MKTRISETQKTAQWFKSKVDPETTSLYECTQWREMVIDRLLAKGYTRAHARVTLARAWRLAGFPDIRDWKIVPHDKVQKISMDDAMRRNLIQDVINNDHDTSTPILRREKVVSLLDDLADGIARFKVYK